MTSPHSIHMGPLFQTIVLNVQRLIFCIINEWTSNLFLSSVFIRFFFSLELFLNGEVLMTSKCRLIIAQEKSRVGRLCCAILFKCLLAYYKTFQNQGFFNRFLWIPFHFSFTFVVTNLKLDTDGVTPDLFYVNVSHQLPIYVKNYASFFKYY